MQFVAMVIRNCVISNISSAVTRLIYIQKHIYLFIDSEVGYRSRYSDWLLAGRPRGWSSSPSRTKNFIFSTSSIPALGPTQCPYPIDIGDSFRVGKAAGE
jgi:hypothetical protein